MSNKQPKILLAHFTLTMPFVIPPDIDLEDKTTIRNYFVEGDTLTIVFKNGLQDRHIKSARPLMECGDTIHPINGEILEKENYEDNDVLEDDEKNNPTNTFLCTQCCAYPPTEKDRTSIHYGCMGGEQCISSSDAEKCLHKYHSNMCEICLESDDEEDDQYTSLQGYTEKDIEEEEEEFLRWIEDGITSFDN